MIPVCRDEISARPAGTDFTLRLHVEIKFRPARRDSFPLGLSLDLHAFSLNFSLWACQFTKLKTHRFPLILKFFP